MFAGLRYGLRQGERVPSKLNLNLVDVRWISKPQTLQSIKPKTP